MCVYVCGWEWWVCRLFGGLGLGGGIFVVVVVIVIWSYVVCSFEFLEILVVVCLV